MIAVSRPLSTRSLPWVSPAQARTTRVFLLPCQLLLQGGRLLIYGPRGARSRACGQGTIIVAPFFSDREIMSWLAVAGLLTVLVAPTQKAVCTQISTNLHSCHCHTSQPFASARDRVRATYRNKTLCHRHVRHDRQCGDGLSSRDE